MQKLRPDFLLHVSESTGTFQYFLCLKAFADKNFYKSQLVDHLATSWYPQSGQNNSKEQNNFFL